MKYFISLLLFALPLVLWGQRSGANSDFDYYMAQGQKAFTEKNFDLAKSSFKQPKLRFPGIVQTIWKRMDGT